MKKAFVFLILFFAITNLISANGDVKLVVSFYYSQLDDRNGLPNSFINTIWKDKDELLWLGTCKGLNSYCGAHFSVVNPNIEKIENSIGSNVIQAITEDQHGNVCISTIGGISSYETSYDAIHQSLSFSAKHIISTQFDKHFL